MEKALDELLPFRLPDARALQAFLGWLTLGMASALGAAMSIGAL